MPPQQQAAQPSTPQIDFGQYSSAPSIDFSKYASGSSIPDTDTYWNNLKDKYDLPHSVDLSKTLFDNYGSIPDKDYNKIDIEKFSKAYQEANPQAPMPTTFLGRSWDEAKNAVKGLFGEGAVTGPLVSGPGPSVTPSVVGFEPPNPKGGLQFARQRLAEFSEHPAAAAGAATTDVALAALPFLIDQAPSIWSKISPKASIEAALTTKLSPLEADTPRSGGAIQPALNNTPREVLTHAAKEGIDLTPGQATESGLAQQLQKAGQTAAVGGKELASALDEQKAQFGQSINNFMDKVDPKRAGLSAESAGQAIQDTQGTAKSVSHDNASQGYAKIDYLMDKPVNPQPISAAWNQVKQNLPMGAEDAILAQTPRSMRAVVSDLLSGNPEGFKPTFNQAIQLRKFFRDLGDTDGLPTQAQAMYKGMSKAVDGAMETTASAPDLNAAADWRAANAGWKDYATKYGDPQSILYKIGRQQDPTKIVTMLQNAPANDILTAKQEMGDAALEPLRRQVVQDIAQSRFNIGHDGIGGYSDSYLKALFPPDQVKELYLKGDLANRLKYDPNPSGTGSNLAATSQLTLGNQAKMSAAAKMSMPRDPLSFLPEGVTKSPPSRGSLPQPISISPSAQQQQQQATGTAGPAPPSLRPAAPYGGRFTQQQVEAATQYGANQIAIKNLDAAIAKETNPTEIARLKRMRADYAGAQ
jgi:hypothetical protein